MATATRSRTGRTRGAATRAAAAETPRPKKGSASEDTDRQMRENPPVEGEPRVGTKRTVMSYIKDFPAFLKLLYGLMRDRRVSGLDKAMVLGAIAYIIMPIDIIPDFIPFLGEVDDLYLLVTALQRLIANAGRPAILAHWDGDPAKLNDLNLRHVLAATAFFLPRRIRRRLRVIGKA
jgi:uncharacterized membrane protein YkvA (DUF1232 family)